MRRDSAVSDISGRSFYKAAVVRRHEIITFLISRQLRIMASVVVCTAAFCRQAIESYDAYIYWASALLLPPSVRFGIRTYKRDAVRKK